MQTLKKEYVYNLYGKESKEAKDRFMGRVINNSKRLCRCDLDSNSFGNILLFPWKHWSLFSYLNDKGLLNSSNKLCATPLKEVVAYYDDVTVKDSHMDKIERIKRSMLKRKGYIDNLKNLAVFEAARPKTLYVIDGYHRIIAYQHLIKSGKLKYKAMSFIAGEVKDIKAIGRFNILFTMIKCKALKT